jgi:hypothetical protein
MTNRSRTTAEQIVASSYATAEAQARIDAADVAFLDTFLALKGEARAAMWRQLDRAAKWRLIARMLERRYGDWSEEEIDGWIAKYDSKWEIAPALPTTDLTIPPVADILALVKERFDQAERHGDYLGAGQLNRVRMSLSRGAHIAWCTGDLLVASVNTPGLVYSVNKCGCTCANGRAGKSNCWHVALYDLLIEMQEERATTADMEADRAAAAELGRRLAEARKHVMGVAA